MAKVITMGEIMLRLSTPNNEKFIQADEFDVNYGGGEANVAVSLANYGHDAEFVTAVPDNEIGECAVAALRKYNVETKHILLSLPQPRLISTLMRSSKVLTGSTSQVLPPLYPTLLQS